MIDHIQELRQLQLKQYLNEIYRTVREVKAELGAPCQDLQEYLHGLQIKIDTALETGQFNEVIGYLDQLNSMREMPCFDKIEPLSLQVFLFLDVIDQLDPGYRQNIGLADFSNIDSDLAYQEIIDPLSNQKRLDILIAIYQNNKRFKELETALDLQAGHLIYHLNPLKASKYVRQDEKKNYFLTEKGETVLKLIRQIYRNYSE